MSSVAIAAHFYATVWSRPRLARPLPPEVDDKQSKKKELSPRSSATPRSTIRLDMPRELELPLIATARS